MLALAAMNIFFVYFAILTGFQKGISWQKSYLIACIIQFMVEIVLNETIECVWIQCIIPMLVSDDVRKVGDAITEIISDLCSTSPKETRLFLNAPDYLFVSTNLAKKFPTLMESIVVQSYFSHVPGELSKLWNVGSVARIRRYHNLQNVALLTTILSGIQYFGTAPFILHRLFIRFLEPFIFGGLVLLLSKIISNPLYIAIMSFVLVALVAYFIYLYMYGKSSKNKLSPITPIIDADTLKVINGSDEEDENNDYNAPIMVVDVNEDVFQQAKVNSSKSSDDDSKGNYDVIEFGNDNQIQKMEIMDDIDDVSEDCDEIDDVRSHTFDPVENVNEFDDMSFDISSIHESDESSASLINHIKIKSDSQVEHDPFDVIDESESDESQNEHVIQEMECVGSKNDYEVSDDGIDDISMGIDSDEYDIHNDSRIQALDPTENEVDDASNGSDIDGLMDDNQMDIDSDSQEEDKFNNDMSFESDIFDSDDSHNEPFVSGTTDFSYCTEVNKP
jgi:hypothetical protein